MKLCEQPANLCDQPAWVEVLGKKPSSVTKLYLCSPDRILLVHNGNGRGEENKPMRNGSVEAHMSLLFYLSSYCIPVIVLVLGELSVVLSKDIRAIM